MRIVKQMSAHACVLACLESFLRDCGLPGTQREILDAMPEHFNVGTPIEGACTVTLPMLQEIGRRYGFSAEPAPGRYAPIPPSEAYLLGTTNLGNEGVKHCVRWAGRIVRGCFELMDPNLNRDPDVEEYAYWPLHVIREARCILFHLRVAAKG
jgi:hypothetical protein